MEFGVYTFADLGVDPQTGKLGNAKDRLREVLQAAKLADEVGLQVFGVGEHHRLDYAISSVPVVLSAISQQTKNIQLTSATTVLSTVDPVRLYEDFATLDLLSSGRAEIMAGRGALVDSFQLFGYNLEQYNELFEEHLELFLKLNSEATITWKGNHRPALSNADISPRATNPIPVWVGVGGTPASAKRAGRYGVGMAIVILGDDPKCFVPLVEDYRTAFNAAGHPKEQCKLAITGHGYFTEDGKQARETFYTYFNNYWTYVNKQRNMFFHLDREDYDQMTSPEGSLFIGEPDEIIEKILKQHELLGHSRFLAQLDIGALPYKEVEKSIELLATKIMPGVNKYI
ncbi:LLM class flavin-dependent oxidoreductase [Viridibacillus sp. FSL E2-0187]|uniref:LLM class flavin-dependent oxidoreductase n=1 Tax=Viridibacillus TaxID=496496 RepID=UPI00187B81E8|nr:LLM class flavin-dependent oxidoreductase [Viridibacillus sp. JNUCC-6]QOV09478.1 LLM class flavin-dependent oxidoreductase [Viridibacillus sp. JNUCC-6]